MSHPAFATAKKVAKRSPFIGEMDGGTGQAATTQAYAMFPKSGAR